MSTTKECLRNHIFVMFSSMEMNKFGYIYSCPSFGNKKLVKMRFYIFQNLDLILITYRGAKLGTPESPIRKSRRRHNDFCKRTLRSCTHITSQFDFQYFPSMFTKFYQNLWSITPVKFRNVGGGGGGGGQKCEIRTTHATCTRDQSEQACIECYTVYFSLVHRLMQGRCQF